MILIILIVVGVLIVLFVIRQILKEKYNNSQKEFVYDTKEFEEERKEQLNNEVDEDLVYLSNAVKGYLKTSMIVMILLIILIVLAIKYM